MTETVAWRTHFTKGWTDEQLWKDYMQARDELNFFEMDCLIRAQGAERRPVDARVVGMASQDLHLLEEYRTEPLRFGSPERDAEHQQLVRLARWRDLPLETVSKSLPESLRTLSYFTHHLKIDPYVAGKDYLTDRAEYDRVQAGFRPSVPMEREGQLREIRTGRDLATYVHTDAPWVDWPKVIGEILFGMKASYKTEFVDNHTMCREDAAFVTWGMPFWVGLIADIIQRTGPINFRSKHEFMSARPEEYGMKRFRRLLPMAFNEGSPMHGSFKAMHDIIARAIAAAICELCDTHAECPNGNSLGYEIKLLAGNISDGRQWAGVHYEHDNRLGIELAEALGVKVAKEHLARAAFVTAPSAQVPTVFTINNQSDTVVSS